MYNTKVLLSVAALAGASRAQLYTDPACNSSYEALLAAAPTPPPALISAFADDPQAAALFNPDILGDPEGFTEAVCSAAALLPAEALGEFGAWGASLLSYASVELSSYDAFVTNCVATGEAADPLTSFINQIATASGVALCPQLTSAPGSGGAGAGASNGTLSVTLSITPTPTAAPTNSYPASSGSGSSGASTSVPTAAAGRPTGVLAGAAAVAGLLGAAALL